MVDFHLLRHFRLNLDHGVEEILEQFKLLTSAVKGYRIGVDRANSELLGC